MNKAGVVIAALVAAQAAWAATVTINGTSVTIPDSSSFDISIRPGNTPTVPVDPIDPVVPEEPPVVVPPLVRLAAELQFAPAGRRQTIYAGSGETWSAPFTTTNNPNYMGQWSYGNYVGTNMYQRTIWISATPGGEPLDERRCSAKGSSYAKVFWQQTNTKRYKCTLARETTYYINIKVTQPVAVRSILVLYSNGQY